MGSLAEAVGYFKASNPDYDDLFGSSIAISGDGNTLAVGAAYEDGSSSGIDAPIDDDAEDARAVYVCVRDDAGTWSFQAFIKASSARSYQGTLPPNHGSGSTPLRFARTAWRDASFARYRGHRETRHHEHYQTMSARAAR